mmetsp:Transcript_36452/g.27029  ORF Transcript_36452/g.27029 Transcript_36452/m.27029 type:complete len:232 (+) Transcript_36452:469-1164(+)
MRKVLNRCGFHRDWNFGFRDLFKYKFEDIFNVFKRERVAQNLPQQYFGHVSKNDPVLAHERLVQDLIHFIVRTPPITHNVVGDCLDELVFEVVPDPLFLQVRVRIRRHPLGVVELHVDLVGAEHVEYDEVDHGFFPGLRKGVVHVANGLHIVLLQLVKSALLTHEALTRHVWHGIQLQEYQIRSILNTMCKKAIMFFRDGHLREPKKMNTSIRSMVCFKLRFQLCLLVVYV